MKLENLEIGMVVKNYRELCSILDVERKTGTAKRNQMSWFDEYFSYKKDGHKFIISEILDMHVEPMIDKRTVDTSDNTHIEYIEKLILDKLVHDNSEGKIFLSKSKLFKELAMVNINYSECRGRIPKLSKFMDINEDNIQEWYNSTSGMLERNLNKALKKLEGQSLIFWTKEITVYRVNPIPSTAQVKKDIKTNNFGEKVEEYYGCVGTGKENREATEDEKRYILTIEHETIKKLNCKNKQDVIRKNLWSEFESTVKNIIFKEYNIIHYWQSYKIIFNPKHVLARSKELNKILLDKEDRLKYKTMLNTFISERSDNNTIARHNRAKNDIDYIFGTPIDFKTIRRVQDSYIADGEKLSHTLINKDHQDIRKQVRNISTE